MKNSLIFDRRGYSINRKPRGVAAQFNNWGQTTLELSFLIIIIAAALLAMSVYMKRVVQGKMRGSWEQLGEHYSPSKTTAAVNTTIGISSFSGVAMDVALKEDSISKNTEDLEAEDYDSFEGYSKQQNTWKKEEIKEEISQDESFF